MDSSSPPPSSGVPPQEEMETQAKREEIVHRTKVIQFLGRTAVIILQNDNGPCPLLAICNVLSLKNSLNLSPEISEVSQEKLLSLVAERLIDSNSNIDDKEAGYVENQQQNISDAIDLLPRLTTGIDVNLKFRRIDDFEFTPECAIFDLLDIPLYHGWIVDPQDSRTADAIGSKSYNTIMEELVSLATQTMEIENKSDPEDDVDFVAATTAALGIPSPCLSRGQSFDDSPEKAKKGDIEEETELLRVLRLSEAEERSSSVADGVAADLNRVESPCMDESKIVGHSEIVRNNVANEIVKARESISDNSNALIDHDDDSESRGIFTQEAVFSISKTAQENNSVRCTVDESTEFRESAVDNIKFDPQIENEDIKPRVLEHLKNEVTPTFETRHNSNDCEARESSSLFSFAADLDSSSGQLHNIDKSVAFASSVDSSEPLYEGEERIMESGPTMYENQEPMYEGEVVLAKQVDRDCMSNDDLKDRLSVKQGELIQNFMKNNASQLTIYGLFCLQDKVKERELCVFFRNNHFNTMFKYEGELYILATDQGYINQPDLVWEKLNEVNGDTLYMTGNFKEFKMGEDSNATWNEQNAIATTADYLAGMDGLAPSDSSFNSDLQLAIALQQQEFEEQQQKPQLNSHQPSASGGSSSGLITGPQVSQDNGKKMLSPKQQSKSKDKCNIM